MSVEWDGLPLLPIRCILDHLSMESALAATSTCRHWRQAMLLYEGRRDTLKLKAKNLEKNLFLTRLFRKHTKKLHIYINCNEDHLNKFMTFVLPQFLDANKLQEVVFLGPLYMQQNPLAPFANLKRIITESLVFKHAHFMQKLAIMGCEMGSVRNDKDRFVHKQVEHYSKPLSFGCIKSPADTILSRCNVDVMKFSALKHIVFEYELISTEALMTLSHLTNFRLISLNIVFKRQMVLPSIDWHRVNEEFTKGLSVAVNIINLPHKRFKTVLDSVFVQGMALTSLKVLFCKTIYVPLISHVCCLYNTSLRELVWADSPNDGAECARVIKPAPEETTMLEFYNRVNPFILLCWQCINLRRLVIHGYWVWQYDLLGFVRLRKSLKMEISSLYTNQGRFDSHSLDADSLLRVMQYDLHPALEPSYIQEVNRFADREWQPLPWCRLPAGLRRSGTADSRASYIVKEVLKPLGVT